MKKTTWLLSLMLLLVSATRANHTGETKKSAGTYVSHFENVLGTSLEIKIKAGTEKQASVAEEAALLEIARMAKILSTYDVNSEFSKWARTSNIPVKVSPELFEVLGLYDQWRIKTGGALDASAQVVSQLWKKASINKTLPTAAEMAKAVAEVKQAHWKLDPVAQTATHLTTVPLVLNSFTKTYIIKKATDAAMAVDKVNAVVVNIGGDMLVAGNHSENIEVSDPKADAENDAPMDKLLISNKAVATSGNYRRGEWINGQWYSHIVDPRSGEPAGNIISATVVSPNATDAGALATAFNVLSPEESAKLAAAIPGTEYLLVTKEGKKIMSSGWNTLELPAAKTKKIIKPAADQWNTDYELMINLELAQFGGFSRRPFVAIWVEDKDKHTVRNIAVWFNKEKWLRDLRVWFAKNRDTFNGEGGMSTISSATRSAGKYSLKWDGKDDKGEYVKPGKYTVYIEVAREHGTYQIMSQEMNCGSKKAETATLAGNTEISAASLDYKKKATN